MLKRIQTLTYRDWFKPPFCVACLWLFGLLIGKWIASDLSDEVLSIVKSFVIGRRNLILLLIRSVLPMLLVALFAYLGKKGYLYPAVLLKVLLLGFSICVVIRAFGSAGWLVATLVFLTEFLSCCIFVFSVLYCLCEEVNIPRRFFLIGCALCVMFALLDYFVLLPFVGSLFQ